MAIFLKKIGDKGQELGTNDQIKVSNLDESYNFVVAHFSFEIILLCQNSIRIYQILKLKFKIT